jgi:hypothetical protein
MNTTQHVSNFYSDELSQITLIIYVLLGVGHNHSPISPYLVANKLFIKLACKSKASVLVKIIILCIYTLKF